MEYLDLLGMPEVVTANIETRARGVKGPPSRSVGLITQALNYSAACLVIVRSCLMFVQMK